MENKLQALTQKLYEEGLSKGKQEAEQLVADARKQADQILADARKQADELRKQAEKNAEDLKKNTLTELSLAGRQMIGTLKSEIESLIVYKSISPAVSAANADPEFIKSLLLEIASHWNGASASRVDLKAVLPADKQAAFDQVLASAATNNLNAGLEITFDNKVKSGFKIGPKDGSYYVSFTDADFQALLNEYLRPKVAELLFDQGAKS